mgnify:CR=1 FL=1
MDVAQAFISRSALQHNYARLQQSAPQSQLLAVIKADAYGHGMIHMARAAGTRSLAVATPEEAGRLIEEGIENAIWVLEGPFSPACLSLSSKHSNIVWVVHQLAQLEMMAKQRESNYQIWLKLDTGMHRLGFDPHEVGEINAVLSAMGIQRITLMSHLADAEDSDSTLNHRQKQRWQGRRLLDHESTERRPGRPRSPIGQ